MGKRVIFSTILVLIFFGIIWGVDFSLVKLAPFPVISPVFEKGTQLTQLRLQPFSPTTPQQETRPQYRPLELKIFQSISPQQEIRPQYRPLELKAIPQTNPQQETKPQYQPLALKEFASVQGSQETDYSWLGISKFTGGTNTETYPTKLEQDEAISLNNLQWNLTGQLVKRLGISRVNTTVLPYRANQIVSGLYKYYKDDGTKYIMAGYADTVYTSTGGNFTKLCGGFATSPVYKWFSFATTQDRCIITAENSRPLYTDGTYLWQMGTHFPLGKDGMQPDSAWIITDTLRVHNISIKIKGVGQKILQSTLQGHTFPNVIHYYFSYPESMVVASRKIQKGNILALRFYDAAWEQDEWVGNYFYLTNDQDGIPLDYNFIIRNDANTLYLTGSGANSSNFSPYVSNYRGYIAIFHRLTRVTAFKVTAVTSDTVNYYQKIIGQFSTPPTDWYDTTGLFNTYGQRPYLAVKEGGALNQIIYNWKYSASVADTLYCAIYRSQEGVVLDPNYSFEVDDSVGIYRADFYKPNFVKVHNNRVWLAGDSANYNMLYWSETGTIDNFRWDNYINLETGDGDVITGFGSFYSDQLGYKESERSDLLVFKRNRIYKIIESSSGQLSLVLLVEGIGCVAPQTIQNIDSKYILFLHTTGLYATDGRQVYLLSGKISNFFKDSLNQEYIYIATAGYDPETHHYYLSVPIGSSAKNDTTLIYNVNFNSFSGANIKGGVWASCSNDTYRLIFADNDSGWVFYWGRQADDISAPVIASYQSPLFDLGASYLNKRFRIADLEYEVDNCSLIVNFYINHKESLAFSDTIVASGYQFQKMYLNSDKLMGRTLSIGFKTSTNNDSFKLSQYFLKVKKENEF